MDMSSPLLLLVGPVLAFSSHSLILRQHEVDHLTLAILIGSCATYGILAYYIHFGPATALWVSFWCSLWLWIAAYRVFLHPLRVYPGPFFARLSKWWVVKQCWDSKLHFHRSQQQLREDYGDYVRTGPRELTIFDAEAISVLHGIQSKTSKGPDYDTFEQSLHQTRDKQFHRRRRRVWDNAFKATLSDFAPRVEEFTDQLIDRLRNQEGQPVPLLETMTYYSYDVMSALAFGQPMGFVKGEQTDVAQKILDIMNGSLSVYGLLEHVPWLMQFLVVVGSLAGPMKEWTDWSVSQMKARLVVKDTKPDLVSHLVDNTSDDAAGRALLYGESRLIISAGGETTSTALTFIFTHLATHPHYMSALRKEFRENSTTYHCQRALPLLDAIIHESMRMWPSVFSASPRVTPPEGLTINGHYIPGNIIVQIPPFAMNRDPRHFIDPDTFIPERWLERTGLVLRKEVFTPFMTGPYSCGGKALAMMELRSVVGRVVNEFDVRMPEGFEEEKYWDGVKDHFTAGPPKQDVLFVRAVVG